MEGASRLKQHDNLHRQISAFQRLLQHAMSKFSKEKLCQMLKVVARGLPDLNDLPRVSHRNDDVTEITCLSELRGLVEKLKTSKRKGIQKEEVNHILHYFEVFFEDLTYLKGLKQYFDEKIYMCLYDYFYDPTEDVEIQTPRVTKVKFADDPDSGHSSMEISDDDLQKGIADEHNFQALSDKEKLSYCVKQLFVVNDNWNQLFGEGPLDHTVFDADSYHELVHFDDFTRFEPILRLIPDIFVKSYKSVELAKLWWTQANKVYTVLPGKPNTLKHFGRKIRDVERTLRNVIEDINNEKQLLSMRRKEQEGLLVREEKCNLLSSSCAELEERKNTLGERYNQLLAQREKVKHQLSTQNRSSKEYSKLSHRLTQYEQAVLKAKDELTLLSFRFRIVEGDFNIELLLRPDIIRFSGDVEEKIKVLEKSLRTKKRVRHETEKKLVLLKTNCEKISVIMGRYQHPEGGATDGDVTDGSPGDVTDNHPSDVTDGRHNNGDCNGGQYQGRSHKDDRRGQKDDGIGEESNSDDYNTGRGHRDDVRGRRNHKDDVRGGRSHRDDVRGGRINKDDVRDGESNKDDVRGGRSQRHDVRCGRSQRDDVRGGRSQRDEVNGGRSHKGDVTEQYGYSDRDLDDPYYDRDHNDVTEEVYKGHEADTDPPVSARHPKQRDTKYQREDEEIDSMPWRKRGSTYS